MPMAAAATRSYDQCRIAPSTGFERSCVSNCLSAVSTQEGTMRALVTGCAGFIGSRLTESLLGAGHSVLGVDCFTDNYERSRKVANLEPARQYDEFQLAPVDLAQAPLDAFLDAVEAVFHLAAEPGVRSSWDDRFQPCLQRNVLATQRLLASAARYPRKPFVYAAPASI